MRIFHPHDAHLHYVTIFSIVSRRQFITRQSWHVAGSGTEKMGSYSSLRKNLARNVKGSNMLDRGDAEDEYYGTFKVQGKHIVGYNWPARGVARGGGGWGWSPPPKGQMLAQNQRIRSGNEKKIALTRGTASNCLSTYLEGQKIDMKTTKIEIKITLM